MSWLGGYKPKPSTSATAPDSREEKRKRLEEERNKRAKNRAALQAQFQQVQEAQQEASQALQGLLELDPEIFEGDKNEDIENASDILNDSFESTAAMPDDEPVVVDYDREDKADGDKAQDQARSIKIEFEANDVKFWFSQLEAEMLMASVNSQWLKKTILQRNLPNKQKEDVKALLSLPKTEAGVAIYLRIKQEIMRIYAPKPQDSYKKALTRTMTGLPSQLGYQIIDDICKKSIKLSGCCCPSAALALWSLQLPVNIRAHISDMDFTADTYKSVFEKADQVYLSAKQVSIAAVARPNLDETLPAFSQQNQPSQAAAIQRNRGGRGGRNRSGTSRGGGNQNNSTKAQSQESSKNQSRGPRHSSMPPEDCCSRHYRHGADAWYCLAPLTCPWVKKCSARP